jgi:hypothetical protein
MTKAFAGLIGAFMISTSALAASCPQGEYSIETINQTLLDTEKHPVYVLKPGLVGGFLTGFASLVGKVLDADTVEFDPASQGNSNIKVMRFKAGCTIPSGAYAVDLGALVTVFKGAGITPDGISRVGGGA